MNSEAEIKRYFDENASAWVKDAYTSGGYNFPTAHHRARITVNVLSKAGRSLKVVDLGCGGGQLVLELARRGHTALGVDQSKEMIEIAESNRKASPPEVQSRSRFISCPLETNDLERSSFDAVTAMGVIYYFTDDLFFTVANKLLKPGGFFVVSARNRLFNLVSITHRTAREIKDGIPLELASEIAELYKGPIPNSDAEEMIQRLKMAVSQLPEKRTYTKADTLAPSQKDDPDNRYSENVERRQHTPSGIREVGERFGFEFVCFYGVHPHIIAPPLNQMLPPGIYDKLSECLEALEHLPISLAWSSQFITVFKKRRDAK